jgi:HNH endonuclease
MRRWLEHDGPTDERCPAGISAALPRLRMYGMALGRSSVAGAAAPWLLRFVRSGEVLMGRHTIHPHAWVRMFKQEALARQNGKCAYCREPVTFGAAVADHIRPKSKGGLDRADNIAAACEPCDETKADLSFEEFKARVKSPWGDHQGFLEAWSRRRIWLATERACRRIEEFAR